jgi:hypothetical protein
MINLCFFKVYSFQLSYYSMCSLLNYACYTSCLYLHD